MSWPKLLRSKRTIGIVSIGTANILSALFPDKFMDLGDTVKMIFSLFGGVS